MHTKPQAACRPATVPVGALLDSAPRFRDTQGVSGSDWKRLANYVRHRRIALGFRERRRFADHIGMTDRTLSTLENGLRVGQNTLAIVERGLGWKPGSAEAVLTGGEPMLADDSTSGSADDAAAKFARLTPHEQRRVMALYALLVGEDGDSETA